MTDNYVSYQSPSTIIAETVYHFLRGSLYGAAFGLVSKGGLKMWASIPGTLIPPPLSSDVTQVTPFHAPGSPGAILEAKTGVFKPAPPFSSISSVPSNAIVFGSLLAVQRLGCKTSEYIRNTQDPWNDFFGCAVAYPYYQNIVVRRPVLHNRVVGGAVLLSILFANL
jgi:hypothetical protein